MDGLVCFKLHLLWLWVRFGIIFVSISIYTEKSAHNYQTKIFYKGFMMLLQQKIGCMDLIFAGTYLL